MAWVSRSDRFEAGAKVKPASDVLGPGSYVQHTSYEVDTSYAPFGSSKPLASDTSPKARPPKEEGPPPGAYDPKLPKAYDSGLPKKHVPFCSSATQREQLKVKGVSPGPGQYAVAAKYAEKQPNRTWGVPHSENKAVFRSTSAPSIPRDHQCFGYEESDNGRLVRQGRRDGQTWYSGRPNDSCGPGHYSFKEEVTKQRVTGGRMLGFRSQAKYDDLPGPGHYIAKAPTKQLPMYSAFASTSEQISTKGEKTRSQGPGPGAYGDLAVSKSQPDLRELHPELQYFGSTVERFKEDRKSKVPDPGAYTDPSRIPKAPKPSFGTCGRFQGADLLPGKQAPGPGHYDQTGAIGPVQTPSILGSTGSLAFGSMESKRGFAASKEQAPGPGTYKPLTSFPEEESAASVGPKQGSGQQWRPPRKPSAAFKSDTPKDVMTMSMMKEGMKLPPPGAYNPMYAGDICAVMRMPPKSEGFGSAGSRLGGGPPRTVAPGPGRYDRQEVTGGKRGGSFNRTAVEGVPAQGRPKGLGFESQAMRFKAPAKSKVAPGPGAYNTEPDWNSRTFNVHFGDVF
jgi:hypothetical protein